VRVYYRPNTGRPLRVAWTLNEIGAPYELIRVSAQEAQQPEHLARHPLGRVPVLEQDDQTLFESTSLCLHLADNYPDAELIPPIGSRDRPVVYQWTIFAMTEIEPAVVEFLVHGKTNPERAAAGAERFKTAAAVIEQALNGREFLVGGSLSVADIVTGGVLALAELGQLNADYPNISAYVQRLQARPAFQQAAMASESILAN
jgi:glutathione S-transferase